MSNRNVTGYNAVSDAYKKLWSYKKVLNHSDISCKNTCVMKRELDEEDLSIPLVRCHESVGSFYGSLGNDSTMSTTDSHNRWYLEGYGDQIASIDESETTIEERTNTRSAPMCRINLDHEGSSGVFCDESCCSDTEPAIVIASQRVRGDSSDMMAYTTYEESSVTETFNLSPLITKNIGSFASTSLVGWNITNLLLSTSLLAFPFAISRGGYVVLPFIVLVAVMANYTSRILVDMMYERSGRGRTKTRVRVDYVDLGQDVFNSFKGAIFVQLLQVLEMVAICVLNLCVLGNLGHEIMRSLSIRLCTTIAAILAFPTFFVQKLVIIGWLQTIGVFSLAIGLILIQGFCVSHYSSWSASNVPIYDLPHLPIAIGIIIYSFGIQSILPGLEERMKEPAKYGRVINITFILAVLVQCVFSITNAMYYGQKTNQLITIDLSDHFALGISTACFLAISILSHFSLPSMVVMEKLDDALHKLFPYCGSQDYRTVRHKVMTILIRMFVMGLSLMLAVIVPYFAYLMAFLGSCITVLLTLIVPCCFHLKLLWDSLSYFEKIVDIFIIIFGISCLFIGSYLSFEAIYGSDAS